MVVHRITEGTKAMGNRFGNYATHEDAARELIAKGFARKSRDHSGEYWTKPSTDGFGYPMTALVEITEEYVAARYTASGNDEPYYQHHFIS